jgi:hypothetical protein
LLLCSLLYFNRCWPLTSYVLTLFTCYFPFLRTLSKPFGLCSPMLPGRSPFYSHTRVIMGLSEHNRNTTSIVHSPSSLLESKLQAASEHSEASFHHPPASFLEQDVVEQVVLVAGKVRPVPTVAVQFRQRGLPKGMLRLVEVEIPVVHKPSQVSTKRFVQEQTEIVLGRLTREAPGFAAVAPYQLRKVLNQLLFASIHASPTSVTSVSQQQ